MSLPPENDGPQPEANQREVIAGASAEYKGQMKVASMIEDALASIRSQARTNDYFVGYSLAEVLDDQLNTIGKDESKDDEVNEWVPGTLATRTKISRINYVYSLLLGSDEGQTEGAIGLAKESESPSDLADQEDNPDSGGIV